MLDQLEELEAVARTLEPTADLRSEIQNQAFEYTGQFIESLAQRPGFIQADCPNLSALQVTEQGKPFEELLALLRDEVNNAGINPASGCHLGYIPGGGLWASSVGDMLAAATNRYAGIFYASPGAVLIENQMIRWLCSLVGYPSTAHGNLTSGGSIANLIAIQAARDAHGICSANVRQAAVYFTAQVHHCVHKALRITGLHEAIQRVIPMNDHYQMDTAALEVAMKKDREAGLTPFMVIASAGTTDTGAIDPLDAVAGLCEQYGAWYHIDAAYGGFFLLLDEYREKFRGIDRADSVVMDPHKGMFLPYGSGAVLLKDAQKLIAANTHQAAYMQDAYGLDEINPADCGPELSRPFRGLRMWLPLHLHGVEPFRAALREKVLLCRYFHEEIQKMGFETGPFPELSVTMFRYPGKDPEVFNRKLMDLLHADGRVFFSSTQVDGRFWIRCAVCSFRTHLAEIRIALDMIGECVANLI
ncbi:MAG: amino acid decarboxylase [Lewinellaceae bacterium]|nr:amino acid decarboxylase [Lewinellaceae bacterium]